VSVGEVADAVGVTKPTLYYHFGDKEGLYAAVLCDVMDEVGDYIRQVTQAPFSVRERLHSLVYGYFLHADSTMEPMLRDTNKLIGRDRATLVWACYEHDFLTPIRELMIEGMQSGEVRQDDPELLVRALMALLDGFTAPEGHTARSPREHQRMASVLVSFFMDGAAPREVLSS
jgi:AcrR family transcriptional regulator